MGFAGPSGVEPRVQVGSQQKSGLKVSARALVRAREMRLKGSRSRFTNQRALDQWSGYAGLFKMNYRWVTVQRFVRDLHDALGGSDGEA